MKTKHGVFIGLAVLIITAMFIFTGCLTTTKASAKSAPDEVGNAAVDEATEAAKEKAREGIRDIFK
jgi:hypothetical protein